MSPHSSQVPIVARRPRSLREGCAAPRGVGVPGTSLPAVGQCSGSPGCVCLGRGREQELASAEASPGDWSWRGARTPWPATAAAPATSARVALCSPCWPQASGGCYGKHAGRLGAAEPPVRVPSAAEARPPLRQSRASFLPADGAGPSACCLCDGFVERTCAPADGELP